MLHGHEVTGLETAQQVHNCGTADLDAADPA